MSKIVEQDSTNDLSHRGSQVRFLPAAPQSNLLLLSLNFAGAFWYCGGSILVPGLGVLKMFFGIFYCIFFIFVVCV